MGRRLPPPAPSPDAFLAALDAALAEEGADRRPPEPSRVATRLGPTRVTSWGARDAPVVVLLPGHGATSASWAAVARRLARTHRVHAVELVGDTAHRLARLSCGTTGGPGRFAVPTTPEDLVRWLDDVLAALAPGAPVVLAGHSYGAWLALTHTVARPGVTARLVLVDPTDCFGGPSPRYLLRALPLLARPTPGRWRAFVRWEARGVATDPRWLDVASLGAGLPADPVVRPARPTGHDLARLACPTLVLVAARSRAHDPRRVAERARRYPAVTVKQLPRSSHHSVPAAQADDVADAIARHAVGTPDRRP